MYTQKQYSEITSFFTGKVIGFYDHEYAQNHPDSCAIYIEQVKRDDDRYYENFIRKHFDEDEAKNLMRLFESDNIELARSILKAKMNFHYQAEMEWLESDEGKKWKRENEEKMKKRANRRKW